MPALGTPAALENSPRRWSRADAGEGRREPRCRGQAGCKDWAARNRGSDPRRNRRCGCPGGALFAVPHGGTQVPVLAAISDKSIAVLPFTDMSEKNDQEYFGDGMAEEILDLLVKIPGLTVVGRTSSFQFKGKKVDLRKVGSALSAAYVLEGSVRKSGDQVRITAQLINTKTGAHEWSETYDRHIDDVLKLKRDCGGGSAGAAARRGSGDLIAVQPERPRGIRADVAGTTRGRSVGSGRT